jgi:hypothetical protein
MGIDRSQHLVSRTAHRRMMARSQGGLVCNESRIARQHNALTGFRGLKKARSVPIAQALGFWASRPGDLTMCNLYSIIANQTAISVLFRVVNLCPRVLC